MKTTPILTIAIANEECISINFFSMPIPSFLTKSVISSAYEKHNRIITHPIAKAYFMKYLLNEDDKPDI
jgi:hypothetical protein